MSLTLLIIVVVIALIFEYINGFHDAANAIATVVSTKVLSPRNALLWGATLNFAGAFAGTHVATTIGKNLVNSNDTTQFVILAALIGAIIWNLFTWVKGIPSSSSHALIGGLLGASIAKAGFSTVHIDGVIKKVVAPMFISPVLGIIFGFLFMLILLWIFKKSNPSKTNKYFSKLQLLSSGIMAFSHGSNDAQKTMGIITLSLVSYGAINTSASGNLAIPTWVIVSCATVMCIGTMGGGWKIIRTMGSKVIKLKPIHGFAAETAAASLILTASSAGIPLSTTHVISTSIMGVGSTQRLSAVKWGVVGNIVKAWVLTIPICMLLSYSVYKLFALFL